jgi:hypothetical protein
MGPRILKLLSGAVIFSKGLIAALCICVVVTSMSKAAENSPLKIGAPLDSLKTTELHDSFNEIRNGHRHEAIDIMRPRGTPVRAVSDGVIRKVFISRQGGLTIYEFDREGAYCFYYAHLDRYADQIHEGGPVARGDVIGYVGTTGDAAPDAPQLHFAIFKLGPDKKWWKGEAINPYPILLRAVTTPQSVWVFQDRGCTQQGKGPLRDFQRPEPASLARSCPEARSQVLPLALLALSG